MDAKKKRLREIMCKLQQGGGTKEMEAGKAYKKDGVIINYHGPYVDSSGEKFNLP